jgi:hypothetical protein
MENKLSPNIVPEPPRPRAGIGGPQTPEGKAVVKKNALKHGLCAQAVVIQAGDGQESQEEFDHLLDRLRADLQPEKVLEEMQVERIAVCYWRLWRCLRAETGEIRKALDSCRLTWEQDRMDALSFAKMCTTQSDSRRTLWQDSLGLNHLLQLWEAARQEIADQGHLSTPLNDRLRRTLPQSQYVPWENREAALAFIDREIGRLNAIRDMYQKKETLELEALKASLALPPREVLDKILRYETTISRQLYKAMAELERLLRIRKGEPVPPAINVEVSNET